MEYKNSCKIHRCALKKSKKSLKYYATIIVFYANIIFLGRGNIGLIFQKVHEHLSTTLTKNEWRKGHLNL